MPITEEENNEIQKKLEEQIEDEDSKKESDKDNPGEDNSSSDDDSKQDKTWWEQRGFASEEKAIESYDSAQSLIGKQGTELGELRKVKPAPAEEKKEEPYDKYDPYDEDNAKYFQQKWAQEAVEKRETEKKANDSKVKAEEDRLEMIGDFIKNHPDKSKADLEKVAQFAYKNGIYNLEHADTVMNANESHSKETDKVPNGKKKSEQIKEQVDTLTDTGGGGKPEPKYADKTQSEWGNIPKEEREQALRDA